MIEQQPATERIDDLPTNIESPQGKLVYLYLEAADGATVDDLNRTLAMNKMSVLSVLETLSSQGLVRKTGGEYTVGVSR
ncbi:helix-turn-helix domain-containing protein [Natrialba swarupiae]|uniref:MarR family transcriptional regulator n=1 Tax=Natrialba swarupiae TaxID=2448032 RepID=A0A5D5AMT2_9EURY|nr:MarR family transcriptional regulator [Natrialba swarupiae]TYT63168.1 MarR family transcriptional regulator [Natrialba swarupiae]